MNVHILSDSPNGVSAYSNMARNLAVGLKGCGHSVTITGFQTYFRPEKYRGIPVLPLLNPNEPDEPQFEQWRRNLLKSKAEVLICIFEAYSHWSIFAKQFPVSFIWSPIEGKGIPQGIKDTFKTVGAVSLSHFGQKELASEGIESTVIYPGWDPAVFRQNPGRHCKYSTDIHMHTRQGEECANCPGRNELKSCHSFEEETIIIRQGREESVIPVSSIPDIRDVMGAEYVIGCVANNMGVRKNLEALIKAFSKMENRKDAMLHIHTAITSRGEPVSYLAEKYKVNDRVIVSGGEYQFSISDRAMNWIYNNFDIHATASRAEGFGVAQLEGMAVGVTQVAPAFGTFPELLGGNERGLLAEVERTFPAPNGTVWAEVNVESLTDKMDALFISPQMRKKMGKDAAEWARQYTWDRAVGDWDRLLGKVGKVQVAMEAQVA